MKKLFKKYKVVMFSTLLLGFIIFYFSINKKTVPIPTPVTQFNFINSSMPNGEQPVIIPNLSIEFNFSKKVDLGQTVVKINPNTDIELSTGVAGKTIILTPVLPWKLETSYTINLTVFSEDGQRQEVEHRFTPVFPTTSDLEEIPRN